MLEVVYTQSGRFGVDYRTDGGLLLYASYTRGYRSGAFNAQAFQTPSERTTVEPETVFGFELGWKQDLLDEKLRLNVSVFDYDYKNQQCLNVDSLTFAQTLLNIDKSRITGVEMEVDAVVLPNLRARFGLGLLDTEVEQGTLNGIDLRGNELLLAPDLKCQSGVDMENRRVATGLTMQGWTWFRQTKTGKLDCGFETWRMKNTLLPR